MEDWKMSSKKLDKKHGKQDFKSRDKSGKNKT
jgi:hypothetical protein